MTKLFRIFLASLILTTISFQFTFAQEVEKRNENVKPIPYDSVAVKQDGNYTVEFSKWFRNNVIYPRSAVDERIQGVVHVSYIIDKDGVPTQIEIANDISTHPDIRAEVIRVLNNSPRFPSWRNSVGRIIPVLVTANVHFRLVSHSKENIKLEGYVTNCANLNIEVLAYEPYPKKSFVGTPANYDAQERKLTILHTNDVHSQVEPTSAGKGGMVRAATFIEEVRGEEKNVLLLSAGDFFQGTPYFNLFHGVVEIELMNAMRYDAACLGNHEFDNGIDSLAKRLSAANFPIVVANYDMSQTPLRDMVKPYIVIEKGGLKIGIVGVGIQLDAYSLDKNWQGMTIKNPIETANTVAQLLKEKENCDLVICLSHLGYTSDIELALLSRNIDIIIGGHSHTTLEQADIRQNLDGKEVYITQTGKSGMQIGLIDISM